MEDLAVLTKEPEVVVAPEAQRAIESERAAYLGGQVGMFRLTAAQQAAVLVSATAEIVEVRPTGELYVPGKLYRDVLNTVFGPGAWAVRHGTPMMDIQEKDWQSTLYLNVFLMAGRCTRCMRSLNACQCGGPYEQACVAMAIGAQAYHPRNARLSYDDALEAAITNGLMRCCAKQLGSYSECWDPRWAEAVREQVCVRVQVQERNGTTRRWRRKDRQPLDGEQGSSHRSASTTSPPVTPGSEGGAVAGASQAGEVIGQIRRNEVRPGLVVWMVVTEKTPERFTDDEHFARQLETAKAQGKRVSFEDEIVETRSGPKRKILTFKVL